MGGVSWPLFALGRAVATGASFRSSSKTRPPVGPALPWMVAGLAGYVVYRRRFVRAPLREIVKAPPRSNPALALSTVYARPGDSSGQPSDAAMDVACRLAAERGSRIVALNVLEVTRPAADARAARPGGDGERGLDEAA